MLGILRALHQKGYADRAAWPSLAFAPFALVFVPLGVASAFGVNGQAVPPALAVPLGVLTIATCYAGNHSIRRLFSRLPPAPRRHAPPPDRPYGQLTITLGTLTLILPVGTLALGYGWSKAISLFQVLGTVTALCFSLLQRQAARSQDGAKLNELRRSVLYMRPFATEEVVFARRPRTGLWRWIPVPDLTVSNSGDPTSAYQAFEQFFAPSVSRTLGAFVALGSPYDILPIAHGAVRIYVSDDEWQRRFAELAITASCLLTSSEVSTNVNWELRHVLANGHASRLFLCTPPPVVDRLDD